MLCQFGFINLYILLTDRFSFSTCPESLDSVWRLSWPVTTVGLEDGQPCPMTNRKPTMGET